MKKETEAVIQVFHFGILIALLEGTGRLTDNNVVLQSSAVSGESHRVKLDLSELASQPLELFAGQIIAVEVICIAVMSLLLNLEGYQSLWEQNYCQKSVY